MKTTLNIDDEVMRRLKARAAREGKTMSELVEGALRRALEDDVPPLKPLRELPSWDMGEFPVDLADREAVDELLEDSPLVRR